LKTKKNLLQSLIHGIKNGFDI